MSAQTERLPVEINAGKSSPTVEIVWDDGHRSAYNVSQLRAICPCATCREKAGENPHQTIKSAEPGKPRRIGLPMFKAEKFQISNMNYVGRYALGVSWADKHQSIFPWALLSEECPCEACSARRNEAAEKEERAAEGQAE